MTLYIALRKFPYKPKLLSKIVKLKILYSICNKTKMSSVSTWMGDFILGRPAPAAVVKSVNSAS
jgi:hypothetical protein